jgi:glycosyltransferase involved in cell wall biosynthesis
MPNRRLKILHYPSVYLDPSRGRPYDMIFIKEHILSVQPYHDNLVLSLTRSRPSNKLPVQISWVVEDGIDTVRIYISPTPIRLVHRFLVYFSVIIALIKIYISGFSPDIFHLHIYSEVKFMLSIANFLKVPAVVTEHWTEVARLGILSVERLSKAKWVYEHSVLVLPVCDYLRIGIETNTDAKFRFRIINNTLDTNVFKLNPAILTESQNIGVLSVARIDEQKDFPTLSTPIF